MAIDVMVAYLAHGLEESGIVDDCPIRTPHGFAYFQTHHELVHGGADLVREQGDWQVDGRDVHAHLLQQLPPLGEQHRAGDEAECAVHLHQQTHVLLQRQTPSYETGEVQTLDHECWWTTARP